MPAVPFNSVITVDKSVLSHFGHPLATLRLRKGSRLNCPVCCTSVRLEDFGDDIQVRCSGCEVELRLGLQYDWFYIAICVAVGITVAHLQGLRGVLLLMCATGYSGVLVVIGAPILAPFFPVKVKLAPHKYIETLNVPTSHRARQNPDDEDNPVTQAK
jgi:hypothetical protein